MSSCWFDLMSVIPYNLSVGIFRVGRHDLRCRCLLLTKTQVWNEFLQCVLTCAHQTEMMRGPDLNISVAPEVIRGQGYSYSCDWWSLGVIMFGCLYGYVFMRPGCVIHCSTDVTSVLDVKISAIRQQFSKKTSSSVDVILTWCLFN